MIIQPFRLCKKCNNQLNKDGSCPYCIWKGDEGPGVTLKQAINTQKKQEIKSKNQVLEVKNGQKHKI